MSDANSESISAKLRRWADESESADFVTCHPMTRALDECGLIDSLGGYVQERELFRLIADEIDREMDELREDFTRRARQDVVDALRDVAMGKDGYESLSEIVDRYYLPRPLFEDGEPVQLGDRCIMMNGTPDIASSFAYTKGDADYVRINGHRMELHERVKRPKRQVLDADGVPIEVGDKVWWDKGHFNPHTVKSLHPDNVLTNHVEIEASDGAQSYRVHPSHLTHSEPDSLEKLLERMEDYAQKYEGYIDGSKVGDFSKELRALIKLDGRDA